MINLSRDEKEKDLLRGPVQKIAHDVFDYADETVAHAEGVPKEELMLECYHKLGLLLAQWAKKLDKIDRIYSEPEWLRKHVEREEKAQGRFWVDYGSEAFGFEVDNLFFAKERSGSSLSMLSDDGLMVSQPYTMWMEDFKELIDFCSENDLDFYVDGFNTHQPGRTFRVVIYKPKTGPRTNREFRENALTALQIYDDLSRSQGQPITRKALSEALVTAGKFEPHQAERMIDILVVSRRMPKLKLA